MTHRVYNRYSGLHHFVYHHHQFQFITSTTEQYKTLTRWEHLYKYRVEMGMTYSHPSVLITGVI